MNLEQATQLVEEIGSEATWLDFNRSDIISYGCLKTAVNTLNFGGRGVHLESVLKIDGPNCQKHHVDQMLKRQDKVEAKEVQEIKDYLKKGAPMKGSTKKP